jgi:hypothetical protein
LRAVPARSRVTVRRGLAAPRLATLAAALGRLQGELDALLAALRDPARGADASAADRLRGAIEAADVAVAGLKR